MRPQTRSEDAASPVIGVMLMLVVTVVIAAVITAFATGLAGDSTATTPMALLEADNPNVGSVVVSGNSANLLHSFDIVHKGGDKFSKENIQIVIDPSGSDSSYGILLVRKGTELTSSNNRDIISTGDRLRVELNTQTKDEHIEPGDLVKWTVSDVRTTGVIAKGEFVVPKA